MAPRKETDSEKEVRAQYEADAEELEGKLTSTEKWHAEAEKRGFDLKPHRQERGDKGVVIQSDTTAEAAVVLAESAEYMAEGKHKKGAPIQPPTKTRTPHTVPANTKPDGTPLAFSSINGIGTQAAKTTGGSVVLSGGPTGGGTILADQLAVDAIPALFSDRKSTDPDMPAQGGAFGISGSGAPNLPRAEMVHVYNTEHLKGAVIVVGADRPRLETEVKSDRLLPVEQSPVMAQTPESWRGGEPLQVGEHLGIKIAYKNFGSEPKHEGELPARLEAHRPPPKAGKKPLEPKTKKTEAQTATGVVDEPGKEKQVKMESKDIKQVAHAEEKDQKVESGVKFEPPKSAEVKPGHPFEADKK